MAEYDAFAETFAKSRKGMKWKEIETILGFLSSYFDLPEKQWNFSLFEVGCGSGRFYSFLRERFPHIHYLGTDISSGMIAIAKSQYDATFEVADMAKLDKFDTGFDALVSIAAFHHLRTREERLVALKGFFRLLSDDWVLAFTVWNLLSERNLTKYGAQRDDKNDFQIKIGAHERYYHGFTREELWELLLSAGFSEVQPTEFDTPENIVCICKKKSA